MTSLQSVREAQNLTVEELSEAANVRAETIRAIESGNERPSFSTALKLATTFGVDVNEITELASVFGGPLGPSVEPLLGPRVGP